MSLPALLRPHSLRHVPLVSQTCARHTPAAFASARLLISIHHASGSPASRRGQIRMAATASPQSSHVVDAIIQDHKEIKTYYQEYKKHSGNPKEQEKWSNQFMWEVARHSVGEELVVYPAMEKYVKPEGKQLADKDRMQHQEVKNTLHKLESKSPGKDSDFERLMDLTMKLLDQHITEEETQDLNKLRESISEETGRKMARDFERTKMFAPTRPHPLAGKMSGNKPPFETLAGLLAAPLDKLRDAFNNFPSEEELHRVQPN